MPVAILALTEMHFVKLSDIKHPSRVDWRGAFLIVAGMSLTVLGIQQSIVWGIATRRTIVSSSWPACCWWPSSSSSATPRTPLIDVRAMAANRAFMIDNISSFLGFGPWLAVFFFGSIYFQVAVHQPPTQAGFSILTMFYSFFIAARIGGGWMDSTALRSRSHSAFCWVRSGWSSGAQELTSSAT